ncbi:MAG: MGMT family protein [Planctomycetota bacterium]
MPYDPRRHGPGRVVGPGFHARVHAVVRSVPCGSVTTYGDIATVLGRRAVARHVGFALAALPVESDVPWHRVVNAQGRISLRHDGKPSPAQARLLRAEGIAVNAAGKIAGFKRKRWVPAG